MQINALSNVCAKLQKILTLLMHSAKHICILDNVSHLIANFKREHAPTSLLKKKLVTDLPLNWGGTRAPPVFSDRVLEGAEFPRGIFV